MFKSRNFVIAALVLAIPVAAAVWWLASPLFLDDVVDEELPFDLPTVSEAAEMTDSELEAAILSVMDKADEMTEEEMAMAAEKTLELSDMMEDKETDEAMPDEEAEWVVVAEGQFEDADRFHQGSGTAKILQQGDQRILRFEDFEVTNGPDLHVLLIENADGGDMGEYVDLGQLKGNVGSQNYEIPADVDLSQFSGIMIYCMPFHVNFSIAALG
ncbi:MAG: DM13 domain-containing protein [Chloroflexota bacterium]